jgi:hypothetical protein
VTPRIKDLIENQLLNKEIAVDDDKLLMDEIPVDASPGFGDADAAADAISLPDEEGKVTLDLDALKVPGADEYELSMESARSLGLLQTEGNSFERKLASIQRKIKLFESTGKLVRESKGFNTTVKSIISEVEHMYFHLQDKMKDSKLKGKYESILENYYSTLNELTEQNMRRRNLSEADVTLKLTGLPDEIDLDSVGVDLITGEGGEEGEGDEEGGDEDLDLGGEEEGGDEEESEEGADEDLDLGGDEGEDEGSEEESEEGSQMESRKLSDNLVVEIDENMLRREIKRMRTLREADETKPQSWGHGAGEVADGFEDDDMGDPFVDIDLREDQDRDQTDEDQDRDQTDEDQDKMDEQEDGTLTMDEDQDDLDEQQDQDDLDEQQDQDDEDDEVDEAEDVKQYGGRGGRDLEQTNKQSRQPGMSESIRRRLATEARLQLEAKKKAQQAKKMQGKKMKEAQQQAKKGQKKGAQQKKAQAKQMQEAYNFYARKFNESVRRSRRLQGMLAEATTRNGRTVNDAPARSAAETSTLRNKLAETNLFNAKLLFTNKLLQNESLTKRQKAEVIERLDEAKSEREVKLVYESLVKTLSNNGRSTVNESVNRGVMGSSSRPQTSAAATLNEGIEADRWARLAGIVK